MTYLFFDTETTGLPNQYNAPIENLENWPRLVQIAWLKYNENEVYETEKEHIIKPDGFNIPDSATRVHGITTERAIQEGKDLPLVLTEFAEAVKQAKVVVAHNMGFDEKIIAAELLRNNINHDLFETTRICTMKSSTSFCKIPSRYGYKWPNLKELHYKLFGHEFENAHDALTDVKICAKCYFRLKELSII